MADEGLVTRIERIIDTDPRYKLEAYLFLIEALEYTMQKLERQGHVTGRELLEGIRDLAKTRFGPMARMVFESWGVKATDDFGEVVFNLVEAGILGKTEQDSKDDFRGVYDFADVFENQFDWDLGS